MAKTTKSKKKTVKSRINSDRDSGLIFAATGILFAGACVILLGNIQSYENIQLLLVGFGAALLVFGGVIIGLAVKPSKR